MQQDDVKRIFEAFFEKYKKTEGDQSAWSAFWAEHTGAGTLEINLTKCPRGTVFKIFVDKKKVTEVVGWNAFFPAMEAVAESRPGIYDEDAFFSGMESMI